MRRLFAVLIVVFIGFWIIYGLFYPFRNVVNDFALNTAGPTIYNAVAGVVNGVINQFGLGGFAAITMAIGLIAGIVAYRFWVRADWSVRRWAAHRTSKDLGTAGVTQLPSTPSAATVRPEPAELSKTAEEIVAEVETEET